MAEICVALLTPFTTSGDVALDALEMHTEFLIAEGVTSLMPSGTTAEGMLLDPRETVEIVRCVARVARGRANVLAHVGRAPTRETVAVAQRVLACSVVRELAVAVLRARAGAPASGADRRDPRPHSASPSAIPAMKGELAARLPGYPVHMRAPLS
jgi:hypothetical protein